MDGIPRQVMPQPDFSRANQFAVNGIRVGIAVSVCTNTARLWGRRLFGGRLRPVRTAFGGRREKAARRHLPPTLRAADLGLGKRLNQRDGLRWFGEKVKAVDCFSIGQNRPMGR
jgi:hypothetical protein